MARTTEQIDAEIAKLKAEREEALQREREEDAKGEEIARAKIGEIVLSFYPDGWRTVDEKAFVGALANAHSGFATHPQDTIKDATAKWKKLNVKKLVKAAVCGSNSK